MSYQIIITSNGAIVFTSNVYDSFVELVNNTDIDFDYPDCVGYEVNLFNNGKVSCILR